MRVFVISLPGESERQASSARQLEEAAVAFEFFEAIRGETVAGRCPFDGYDEQEFVLNTGRYITGGEKGCFASHRALWMKAVSLDEPIVVMEDDFHLSDSFAAAIGTAQRLIDQTGFLRLQKDLCARKCPVTACDDFVLSRYTKPPHGSMAYCISPGVAQHFLSLTTTMDAPIDVFIKKFWTHRQPLYALTPYPVVSSPLSEVPTIARRPKQKKPLPVAARRFLRKAGWQCSRFAFNFRRRLTSADKTVDATNPRHVPRLPTTPA